MSPRSILVAIAISFAPVTASAAPQPYLPTDEDMALIRTALAEQMLDPESTIVSDVVAAVETVGGSPLFWVCGMVRGRNGLGGYAQPTPFMGSLLESKSAGRSFVVIRVAGQSAADQEQTLRTCLDRLK